MIRSYLLIALIAVSVAVIPEHRAAAQNTGLSTNPQPRSSVGGYTGQTLQNLYRTDIGTGYSANRSTARCSRIRRPASPKSGSKCSSTPAATIGPGVMDRAVKPFTNITTTPTVSPYLNLFNTSRTGNTDFNYQTLVRPQLQQQAVNQQLQRQNLDTDRRVQALAARGAFQNQAGSDQQYPTGHQTTFMYTGHYYTDANPHRKRQ